MVTKKIPPHDENAEKAVIGGLLIQGKLIDICYDNLSPEDFYFSKYGKIYKIMGELYRKDKPIDIITLTNELRSKNLLEKVGGAADLTKLVNEIPSTANFSHYMKLIRDKAIMRKFIETGSYMIAQGFGQVDCDEFCNEIESKVMEITNAKGSEEEFLDMETVCRETFDYIENVYENRGEVIGVPTGFGYLDHLTAGLQPGDLIIIAARPSMGKTTFVLNLAINAATKKKKVGFISLEMSRRQLALKQISMLGKLDSNELRRGNIQENDWSHISHALGKLAKMPIFIADKIGVATFSKIRSKIRRLITKHKLDLIIIDYLQLIDSFAGGKIENRQQEVTKISRGFKLLASELDIPIVALSQLSRSVEQRHDKRPLMSDLRESGAIEQDADIVAFLYREGYYVKNDPDVSDTGTELIIAKQRNGPVGTVYLEFMPTYSKFVETNEGVQYDYQ